MAGSAVSPGEASLVIGDLNFEKFNWENPNDNFTRSIHAMLKIKIFHFYYRDWSSPLSSNSLTSSLAIDPSKFESAPVDLLNQIN